MQEIKTGVKNLYSDKNFKPTVNYRYTVVSYFFS